MSKILVDTCEVVVTMDDTGREIPGGSILIENGVISWVGSGTPPEADGAERVSGSGTVALPGLINTHHHLYQALTRVRAQDQGLFGWLKALYPVWAGIDEEWEWAAACVGLAELALSGCSTTTDHHYVFPREGIGFLEAEIRAAREIGLRFHPTRGSMDLGVSDGGLPPDSLVQDTDTVLAQTEDAVKQFHDPATGSMLRIGVAPCSPFSVTERLMRESADLARRLGVRLHTHAAETLDEEAYCQQIFGRRPVELLDEFGWLGSDVWLAHCVHLKDQDIQRIASSGTSVAWCPTSNLRTGSGIAPMRALRDAGASVGLAVDGSASNDIGHMLAEARIGTLAARINGPDAMSARETIRIATRGSASCLGRNDIGSLEPGKRGDVALVGVDGLRFVGAEIDLVAALVYCAPQRVKHLFVEGKPVVRDGRLVRVNEHQIVGEGRRVALRILDRSLGGRGISGKRGESLVRPQVGKRLEEVAGPERTSSLNTHRGWPQAAKHGLRKSSQGGLGITKPHVMGKDALTETPVTTSGITRHVAFQGKDFRVSRSLVVPGIVSGWHHHGAYDQYGYMVSGAARLEYGPAGDDAITVGPGDFWHMPANTIHRDVNPSATEGQVAIIFYRGTGPMVVNVEGPEPG